ncbi:hypothetical protein N7467_004892 [Penicillium canescens]|nr:hypothetical protein N7467_004892 [Penicillium canescens]
MGYICTTQQREFWAVRGLNRGWRRRLGAVTVRAGSSGDAAAAVIEDRQTIRYRISLTVIAVLEGSTQCVATAMGSRGILIAVYNTLASVRWNREGSNGDKNKIEEPHIGR